MDEYLAQPTARFNCCFVRKPAGCLKCIRRTPERQHIVHAYALGSANSPPDDLRNRSGENLGAELKRCHENQESVGWLMENHGKSANTIQHLWIIVKHQQSPRKSLCQSGLAYSFAAVVQAAWKLKLHPTFKKETVGQTMLTICRDKLEQMILKFLKFSS